jgi:hypothetical protein
VKQVIGFPAQNCAARKAKSKKNAVGGVCIGAVALASEAASAVERIL